MKKITDSLLKENRVLFAVFMVILVLDIVLISIRRNYKPPVPPPAQTWKIQAIDTVKYSRDPARQYISDPSFDKVIDTQTRLIAETGANYISIGTPYDPEFVPFLTRWVTAARKYNLKVWFRGNFSGWEGWFEYPKIGRDEHLKLTKEFILKNGDLFEDGDIFTSCTECENGGPGDPRSTGDTLGHRQFLIDEYKTAKNIFVQMGKNIPTNYFSMNYDVAMLTMDKETTKALGGIVVIDHYVITPELLISTIDTLKDVSGGKIILGEFGAPIPDIHGVFNDDQQAAWIETSLKALALDPEVTGINYWTAFGGTTRLWQDDGNPTKTVNVLNKYFKPKNVSGVITNEIGEHIKGAEVISSIQKTLSGNNGEFVISYVSDLPEVEVTVKALGYEPFSKSIPVGDEYLKIELTKSSQNWFYKLQKLIYQKFGI